MNTPPQRSPASQPRIHWSGQTDVGRFRTNNEDVFLALTFDGHEVRYLGKEGDAPLGEGDFIFAVSDGMGGARSGEFASRSTVDRVTRLLPRAFRLSAAGLASGFQHLLGELVSAIHQDLLRLGSAYEECNGMGATLSLGWVTPEWMYFAHVGDSRIYHLRASGGMTQLTHDHSYVGWLCRQGKLNEREARTHPRRNALQQALGAGNQFVDPHIGAVAHQPGDRFVWCSDGVVDGLWDHQIEELVRSSPNDSGIARRLVDAAVEASGRDNATAIVARIEGNA